MPFLAPAIAAASTAISAFAATTFGSLAINAAIGIGLSYAAQQFRKKPDQAENRGTRLEVQYGGDRPREIIVGLAAVAGHDVYTNSYGSSNKYLQKVFVLSDFAITRVTRIAVNGEWRTIDWTDVEERGAKVNGWGSDDYLRVRVYDGRHTALQAVESSNHGLIGASNPAGRWTAEHVGRGVSFIVVNLRYEDEDMASLPQFLFEVEGAPLYDVRKDSTAGGSGSHRWDDQGTWEYSENPIVIDYNYERGFWTNGQLIIGKGMPASDLPAGPWMSAANVCDEGTAYGPRYRAGYVFTAADGVTHADNLQPVLDAAGAGLVERVDGDHPVVGANQPVVATLTDADLIVDAPLRFQAKRSRSDLINAVFGKFNSPDDLWSATAYEPQLNAEALAVDRERHAVPIDFAAVHVESQAASLAAVSMRANRYQASASIVVRPRWVVLEVGDWIRWLSAKHGDRVYRVVGRRLAPLGPNGARNVSLTLEEIGNGVYDTTVVIPERPVRVVPAPPTFVSTVSGFQAYASSATAENGRVLPAVTVQWDASIWDDVTVDAVLVEYWRTDDDARRIQKRFSRPAVAGLVLEGLLPLTSYTLQATVVTNPPRTTFFSGAVVVTTLAEDLAVTLAQLRAEIQEVLAFGPVSFDRLNELIEQVAANSTAASVVLRTESDRTSAEIIEERTVRASETEALATRTDGVVARLTDVEGEQEGQATAISSLSASVTDQDGRITANAEAITGVNASVGELSAQGLIRFQAVVAPAGVSVRIAILARATTASGFAESGIYIDVFSDGTSRIVNQASKFIVTDGGSVFQPLVFEGGVLKLAVGRFQQLISDNGRLEINGSTGTILLRD